MLDMLMITTPRRMPLPLGLITCLLVLYSLSACAPQPSVIHLASRSSPRPLSPLTGSFFVEADLLLQWEGSLANANQVYSGQPASIERAVFGAWQTLEACDAQGICAYDNLSPVAQYYGAFRYGYSDTFWVNPDRFDVSQRIEAHGNRNLAELLTGNPRDFSFRFDSWTQGN